MTTKVKVLVVLLFGLVGVWFGYTTYTYFTCKELPVISVSGVSENGSCKNALQCNVDIQAGYKPAEIYLLLDGQKIDVLMPKYIGKKTSRVSFPLDTKLLKNGQHEFEVKVKDGSYNSNEASKKFNFNVDNTQLTAALLKADYKVEQGRTAHILVNSSKKIGKSFIKFMSKSYEIFSQIEDSNIYECFVPVDCDLSTGNYSFIAEIEDLVGNIVKLSGNIEVLPAEFKRQVGFVVAKQKLTEEKEAGVNNKILEDILAKAILESPKIKNWTGKFELPVDVQRIATPFGEVRVTVEKGKYVHKAVDLINFPKSVVWASQDGKVIVKDRFEFSGNTVVLDHGCGIFTLYFHLDDFADISVGDVLKKGNPLGKLGKTGYATGYHLHWELRVNNLPVDPMQWVDRNF